MLLLEEFISFNYILCVILFKIEIFRKQNIMVYFEYYVNFFFKVEEYWLFLGGKKSCLKEKEEFYY